MKKLSLLLLTLVLSFHAQADTLGWNSLLGCYETVELDGEPVAMGSDFERSLTKIETGISSVFEDLDYNPLQHVLIVLFTGAHGPWYGYHSFVALPQLGEIIRSESALNYSVDEDLYFVNWGRRTKVDHNLQIDLEVIGDKLVGHAKFQSLQRSMDGERTFTLKKVACP